MIERIDIDTDAPVAPERLDAARRALGGAPEHVEEPAVIAGVGPEAPEGYYARKFDQGKPRWHLLPMDAAGYVLSRYVPDLTRCDLGTAMTLVVHARASTVVPQQALQSLGHAATRCIAGLGGPALALALVVDVLEFGATKYAPESWRLVPDAERRYLDAAMRHLAEAARHGVDHVDVDTRRDEDGGTTDLGSGLPVLAHALCDLLFAIELQLEAGTAAQNT